MGQRPGIQNDPLGRFARLLDPVDELTFMIGLPKIDLEVERSSPREAALLDIRQRVMPVNRWVAHPEQVQIWAVQDKDGRQACTPFRRFFYTTQQGFKGPDPPCGSQRSNVRDLRDGVLEVRPTAATCISGSLRQTVPARRPLPHAPHLPAPFARERQSACCRAVETVEPNDAVGVPPQLRRHNPPPSNAPSP